MLSTFAACRLKLAAMRQVGDNDDRGEDGALSKRFTDLTFGLISIGTVALIATSIRVWAGMSVIENRISALVQSDNQQDSQIEQVRTEVNNLRVQVGILRATTGASGLGRP